MSATRLQKIGRLIKEELSLIIRREMNDPRLGFFSITDVVVPADLRSAHVYISVYGSEKEQGDTMTALESARRFLRGELGKKIDLRHTPELFFHLDRSIERGARVFELLKQVEPPAEEEKKEDNGQS